MIIRYCTPRSIIKNDNFYNHYIFKHHTLAKTPIMATAISSCPQLLESDNFTDIKEDNKIKQCKEDKENTEDSENIKINDKELKQFKELAPRPYQEKICQDLIDILRRSHVAYNHSATGTGKTEETCYISKYFDVPMLIICPCIAAGEWRKRTQMYGSRVINIITYGQLRSKKFSQPQHGYLIRNDTVKNGRTRTTFSPTSKYLELVQKGLFVVADEAHYVKNPNAQLKAFKAITDPILKSQTSRFILLSATPATDEKQSLTLLKLIGYIRTNKLATNHPVTGSLECKGIKELIDICMQIDSTTTCQVLKEYPILQKNMQKIYYNLYVRVVKNHISKGISKPYNPESQCDIKNGFYKISPESEEKYRQQVKDFSQAVKWNPFTETIHLQKIGRGGGGPLGRIQIAMELSKVEVAVRMCHKILDSQPNAKFIIAANFVEVIEKLNRELNEYHPLLLYGKISENDRLKIIDNFNDNPNYRLLIMNADVGGQSISLHDTKGDSPRYMMIFPSIFLTRTIQVTGRTDRDGTRSNTWIRFIYSKSDEGRLEYKIRECLSRSSTVLRDNLCDEMAATMLCPDNYGIEVEDD